MVYPVRSYGCTEQCQWQGLLPSVSRLERRKRQVRVVLALVVLAVAAGLAVWKYGAGLTWSLVRPAANDGVEESGGAQ